MARRVVRILSYLERHQDSFIWFNNFRPLKDVTQKDGHPLPRISNIRGQSIVLRANWTWWMGKSSE